MKRKSVVSRNFLRRPRVRGLVPDLRWLLVVLNVGCESFLGVWVPVGLEGDSGFEREAVAGGLQDLEKHGFIIVDPVTGEIFLTEFFRDNEFKGIQRHQQALAAWRAIESPKLRAAVLAAIEANPGCGLSVELFREKTEGA